LLDKNGENNVLIENFYDAKKFLEKMDEEESNSFIEYPVIKLLK